MPAEHFAVDLTIARGLDYYTGTVYETTLCSTTRRSAPSAPAAATTTSRSTTPTSKLPGVGISIGLTRLFYVLGEQGYLNDRDLNTAPADVLILPMTEDLGAAISTRYRICAQSGIRTQLYSGAEEVQGTRSSYADKLGHSLRLSSSARTRSTRAWSLSRTWSTGEQVKVSLDEAAKLIHDGLAKKNAGKVICDK